MRSRAGFTLLEIIVVLAIVGILAGMTATMGLSLLNQARERATFEEVQEIHRAVIGDPELGTFGFVGDMGRLPYDLSELVDRTGQPSYGIKYTLDGVEDSNGIKWGWNGPYLNIGSDPVSYKNDAWGRSYAYNSVTGKVASNGTDKVPGTPDDIIYPPYDTGYGGDVTLTVFVKGMPNWYEGTNITVELGVTVYSYNDRNDKASEFGTINSVLNQGKSFGFYNLTQGFHPVKIKRDIFYTGVLQPETKTYWLNVTIPPRGQVHQNVYIE